MSYRTLQFEQAGEIATITLDRPEKRNAISKQMIEDLLGALSEAETGSARVTILTGSGGAFCSGMDLDALRALAGQSQDKNLEDSRLLADLFYRIHSFPKPSKIRIHGSKDRIHSCAGFRFPSAPDRGEEGAGPLAERPDIRRRGGARARTGDRRGPS
jgi:hypothetical protein